MERLLYTAAVRGSGPLVEVGSERDPNYFLSHTPRGNTALHIAAMFGHTNVADAVVSFCPALLDVPNLKGDTPLHVAARAGFFCHVQFLTERYVERAQQHSNDVEQGPSPSPLRRVNSAGNTALHEALRNRHWRVARYLLSEDGGLSSIVNNACESPLYLAAEFGFRGIIEEMLKQEPAIISVRGPNGKTPLHAAVIRRRINTVKLLLMKRPEFITKVDNFGRTALHYAASCSVAITRLLLDRDHSLAYVIDNDGCSPLFIATRYRRPMTAGTILRRCPDCIELTDLRGRNVIHMSATGYWMLSRFLARPESAGLLNEADNDGNTPLHLATKCQHYENAMKLIQCKGVDLNAKNNDGHTAMDMCELIPELSFRKRLIWRKLRKRGGARGRECLEGRIPENLRHPLSDTKADLKPAANTLSVIAALLATVSCAAAFAVPGGYTNDGPQQGLAVLARKVAFKAFLVADAIAVCASLSVSMTLNWAFWGDDAFLRNVFNFCMPLTYVALSGVGVAFATATFAVVSRVDLYLAVIVCTIACMSPLVPLIIFRSIIQIK